MKIVVRRLCTFVFAVLLPSLAYAQGTIAGIVRDTSGAVLPGVTVEAASPALIEKVRTVVTDGSGQYRIVDLRPGTYSVTFILAGFSSVKQEGIEIAGNFTATVNGELRVGSLEETITVTGAPPVVDTQNVRQQQTMDRDVIASIPSGRSYQTLAVLITGLTKSGTQDVGGAQGDTQVDYTIHGGKAADGRLQVDGLSIGAPETQGANRSMFVANVGASQEIVFSTSGGLGEADTGGVVINVIPREGGNTIRGMFYLSGANSSLQSDNFTPELAARGLRGSNRLKSLWDVSPAFGGPIARDRLWYYVSGRYNGTRNYVAGMYENVNRGNMNAWGYEPDLEKQTVTDGTWKDLALRLTFQATPRNKFNIYWDEQDRKVGWNGGGTATQAIEGSGRGFANPNRVQQGTWSSPLSQRILLEAGMGTYFARWGNKPREDYNPALVPVTEQAGRIPGLQYRAPNTLTHHWSSTVNWRASFSYVTGSHSAKFGYIGSRQAQERYSYNGTGLSYRFNNGVANQLTQYAYPLYPPTHFLGTGLYAQDQWKTGRLTLQGGLRFDRFTTSFPAQQLGPSRFLTAPIAFPASDGAAFNDITPRAGAVYDLFGNGRTAVKVNLGKYVIAQDGGAVFGSVMNPLNRLANTVNRAWTDSNGNYVPDCDLVSQAANGECGPMANQNFGKAVFASTYDPAVTAGWGVRPYSWEFGTSVQHELLPRVAVNLGYFRRWYGNFTATDNRSVTPADFDRFTIASPQNASLPGGGGASLEFFDVTPGRFGLTDNFVTAAKNFGKQIEHWNGFDLNVATQVRDGLTFSGGFNMGKTTTDNCEIVAKLPEMLLGQSPVNDVAGQTSGSANQSPMFCRVETPFLTQFKFLGTYTIPKVDVQVSGTLQNVPGPQLVGNWVASSSTIAAVLGRPLAGGTQNLTLNVVSPGTMYGDRINQIDLRVAKVVRLGAQRLLVGLDIYNAVNSNVVQTYNQTVGAAYLTPTLILPPRFVKISGQLDF